MKIIMLLGEQEKEFDIPEGMTIAEAAQINGIHLFGSCKGQDRCGQCSRLVREGIEKLLLQDGTPYVHKEGYAPYVKTCQVSVGSEGVHIDATSRARLW